MAGRHRFPPRIQKSHKKDLCEKFLRCLSFPLHHPLAQSCTEFLMDRHGGAVRRIGHQHRHVPSPLDYSRKSTVQHLLSNTSQSTHCLLNRIGEGVRRNREQANCLLHRSGESRRNKRRLHRRHDRPSLNSRLQTIQIRHKSAANIQMIFVCVCGARRLVQEVVRLVGGVLLLRIPTVATTAHAHRNLHATFVSGRPNRHFYLVLCLPYHPHYATLSQPLHASSHCKHLPEPLLKNSRAGQQSTSLGLKAATIFNLLNIHHECKSRNLSNPVENMISKHNNRNHNQTK